MLSLNLRPIMPPKMPFFVRQTNANLVKNFATNLVFLLLCPISSKINIFVTTASFRHFVSFPVKTKSFGAYT